MGDQTFSGLPSAKLDNAATEFEVHLKLEPEMQPDDIKIEPDFDVHSYDAGSEYYQNPYATEDSVMTHSGYNTDSGSNYAEIGTMDDSSSNNQGDEVWNHFEKLGDDNCAICNYCYKMFAYKSSILNLVAHLRRAHLDIYNEHFQVIVEPVASTSKDIPEPDDQRDREMDHAEHPKKPALAWDHFYRIDRNFAICRHCRRKLSYKTTTGNLNAHMRRVHKPILMKYLKELEKDASFMEKSIEARSLLSDDLNAYDTCSKIGIIWKFFDKLGDEYAMCKTCYKELSCRSTTGNLSTHLKRNHPSLYAQYRSIADRDPNEFTPINIGEEIPLSSVFVDHFDKIGRYTALCKYCSKRLPLSTSSSSLSRHLRLAHSEAYVEYKANKQKALASGSLNDTTVLSDSGDSEAEREDEKILFDEWKKKGGLWAHFLKEKNFCATCKYCHKTISYKGTTGNLTGHLRRTHKSLYLNKDSDKNKSGTKPSSSTITSTEVNIGNDNSSELKQTGINENSSENSANNTEKVTILSDTSEKTANEIISDKGSVTPNKFQEVLIKFEMEDPEASRNESVTLQKTKANLKQFDHSTPKKDSRKSLDNIGSDISLNFKQDKNECSKKLEIQVDAIKEVQAKTMEIEIAETATTSSNVIDALPAKISSVAQGSDGLFKLKRISLVWMYYEKGDKTTCTCKICQKPFLNCKEVPLIFHLKAKHPEFHKSFMQDQLLGSYFKPVSLESLHKKKGEKLSRESILRARKKRDSIAAQCIYCTFICHWSKSQLVEHLENNHSQLYTEFKSHKAANISDDEDIDLAKLKKNAVPSVFLTKETPVNTLPFDFTLPDDVVVQEKAPVQADCPEDTMTANNDSSNQNNAEEKKVECRVCLKTFEMSLGLYDIFQPWFLSWAGMENTVAADLAKLTKIQISPSDVHSKHICYHCCIKLRDACEFTAFIKRNDQILRLRSMQTGTLPVEKWPKPISLDTSVDTTVMEIDIKQEYISEHDGDNESMDSNATCVSNTAIGPDEIKVEPEEVVDHKPDVDINGVAEEQFDPGNSVNYNNDGGDQDDVATQSESANDANAYCGKIVRRDFCLFCEKLVVAFPKHLTQMHSKESEMQRIMTCPKQSVERKKLVGVLRKKGNYTYKEQLLTNPQKYNRVGHVPCPECLGIFRKKLLARHQKMKHGATSDFRTATREEKSRNADIDKRLLEEVFPTMRTNRISIVAKKDKLICAFGAEYIRQHKTTAYVNVTSRKMRELAKVLIEMQKMDPSIQNFEEALQPKNYNYLVKSTKIISGYNEETAQFARPTLAVNICTSFRQCCNIAIAQAQKSGKDQTAEIEGYKEAMRLINLSYKWDISKKAFFNMTARRLGEVDQLKLVTLAKTVKLFLDYLTQKAQYLTPQLTCSGKPQEELYIEFSEALMCRVLIFNRRRASEIQDIKLVTYDKVNSGRFYDLYKANSFTEQIFMKKCKCVMVSGRKEQVFPVYFTPEMVKEISMLRSVRDRYFNTADNPYLFPLPGSKTFIKGLRVMEKHGRIFDSTTYKPVSTMRYRKHVATLTQIFSMTWVDIHDILNLLELKQEHRLPDDVEQAAKLCKILLSKDGVNCQGKSIDELDLDMDDNVENLQDAELDGYEDSDNESHLTDPADLNPAPVKKVKKTRTPFTPEQKEVVMNFFSEKIKNCQPPKLHECNTLKQRYPELLHNKDWIKIKAFVQNYCRKKKKP